MKTFNLVDLILQSVLIFVAVFAIGALISGFSSYLFIFFIVQFVTGVVQIGSTIIHLARSSPGTKTRVIHLTLSALYLAIFAGLVSTFEISNIGVQIVNAMPWLLASFYYLISWRLVFPPRVSGSGFLPHLSF